MGFFSFNLNILLNDRSTVGGHMSKKGPPNYCEFFTTGDFGTVIQTENGPAFFRLFFAVITYIWFSNQKKMGHSAC
jgi:hypothetical protein